MYVYLLWRNSSLLPSLLASLLFLESETESKQSFLRHHLYAFGNLVIDAFGDNGQHIVLMFVRTSLIPKTTLVLHKTQHILQWRQLHGWVSVCVGVGVLGVMCSMIVQQMRMTSLVSVFAVFALFSSTAAATTSTVSTFPEQTRTLGFCAPALATFFVVIAAASAAFTITTTTLCFFFFIIFFAVV